MKKAGSKKQQLIDQKNKEHSKKYLKTAKKKKDPEAPYSDNPTPGKPGWNVARGPNSVNET